MKPHDLLDVAHLLVGRHLTKHDVVVDMTAGNGHDTVFLARHAGHVLAYDIQPQAIEQTRLHLAREGLLNVTLIQSSHVNINDHVGPFKGFVFNLGYLPGGDKTITTRTDTTIQAIETALSLLAVDGFMLVVCYPGHSEGEREARAVDDIMARLDHAHYHVIKTHLPNTRSSSPYFYFLTSSSANKKDE